MDQEVMSLKYIYIYIYMLGGRFVERNTVIAQG